ncbi:MAG: aspartyl protease family protein [Chthoniobacterales bacterium]
MTGRILKATGICLLSAVLGCSPSSEKGTSSTAPLATIALEPYLKAQAVVHATVNGQPGTFLFDTGEGVSSFSPQFAKKIGCEPWGRTTGFRMSGERLDNEHCDNITFDFSGHAFVAPVVITIDIMKFLGPEVPPVDGALGLDLFAGRAITIIPRKAIIVESRGSLEARVARARELPIRIVRDAEGVALALDGAVKTPKGTAWMELDSGNGGSFVVSNHIAPLIGLRADMAVPEPARFELANGIVVEGTTRTRDLIMDGNIGAQFLNNWILTLDLEHGRAWLSPPAKGN